MKRPRKNLVNQASRDTACRSLPENYLSFNEKRGHLILGMTLVAFLGTEGNTLF